MTNYDDKSIRVLGDIEHVRLRPTMYINTDRPSFQMFDEIFSNALDEAINGYATELSVEIDYKQSKITVTDNGRGLPQGINEETGKPTIVIIYSKLNSGGKYNQDSYGISGGLNGVGSCVVNALSKRLDVVTWRDKIAKHASFSEGILTVYESIGNYKSKSKSGTIVSYFIDTDHKIFTSDSLSTYEQDILNKFRLVKTLRPDINLVYNGSAVDPVELDKFLVFTKSTLLDNSIIYNSKDIKLAINWSIDTNVLHQQTYCNFIHNILGGDNEKGLEDALVEYFNNRDILLGLRLVISTMYPNVEYDSQAKLKAVSKDMRLYVKDKVLAYLKNYFKSNPDDKEKIIQLINTKRVDMNKRNNKSNVRRDRKTAYLNALGVNGFADCTTKCRDDAELYICEGESAAGSLKQARDVLTQAIMPLRGKFINAYTADVSSLLKNAEVATLLSSINTGIYEEANIVKSRYGKIIITTDADEDGKNIACLLIAFFANTIPDLLRNGLIYLALPPLYGTNIKNTFIPIYTELEKDRYLAQGAYVQRYKGLGEMSVPQISLSCMNKETRKILQLVSTDACMKVVADIMGSNSDYRRDLLKKVGVLL